MRLRLLAKDGNSGDVGCPSVHLDEDTSWPVFMGQEVDLAHLPNALPGERAVTLDPTIVRAAMRELGWL